jgi:hypothetical protein
LSTGSLYILVNPSFGEGFLKIGMTTRSPRDRARDLSATTGVPTPFVVAYDERVPNCLVAERLVQARLAAHRVSEDREFFHLPLRDAIAVVAEVAAACRRGGSSPALMKMTVRGVFPPSLHKVEVTPEGDVVYCREDGDNRVEETWLLNRTATAELFDQLRRCQFEELQEDYSDPWTDYPVIVVEVTYANGVSNAVERGYGGKARRRSRFEKLGRKFGGCRVQLRRPKDPRSATAHNKGSSAAHSHPGDRAGTVSRCCQVLCLKQEVFRVVLSHSGKLSQTLCQIAGHNMGTRLAF